MRYRFCRASDPDTLRVINGRHLFGDAFAKVKSVLSMVLLLWENRL